jgi:pilus assembly protein CpaF
LVWINEPTKGVHRPGRSPLTTTVLSEDQVRDLVEKMLQSSKRRIDPSALFVDATLSDGSRLHVVIQTSRDGSGR